MKKPCIIWLFLLLTLTLASDVKRSPVDPLRPEVVQAREFALSEVRKLCAHCSEAWEESYRNLRIPLVISVESAPSVFGDGTNYFFQLELQTDTPGKYKGIHSIVVFEKSSGGYKGISIDEFPQIDYVETYPL
mmetsp:Transcript_20052/g.34492  ORF Transcript_20052/g.34492 Transcript_20052/m.34492 type:complete len:133 (+) Transcript_20052:67-465(+)|eukprot:CAMPEP_0196656392 /NCGR_PEP_ID=MMETSP1086-20130531/16651_1 /TAXON_ID=77921 /ORGANISM="Cyanoptyche  gloeocystis , Strain SAG4.97" /LENGTH=132 /DNA_ID=CAMNT_0041989127 /DNA_START=63 /DNA_END=461 /DNA_ORIENTATION=+